MEEAVSMCRPRRQGKKDQKVGQKLWLLLWAKPKGCLGFLVLIFFFRSILWLRMLWNSPCVETRVVQNSW